MTTNQELQHTAARVLADLLATPDLPEADWHVQLIGRFAQCFTTPTLGIDLVTGQVQSHQAVRDWAAHLGTSVELRHGTTPDARAILDGICVRVWCAPQYRDDVNSESVEEEL